MTGILLYIIDLTLFFQLLKWRCHGNQFLDAYWNRK